MICPFCKAKAVDITTMGQVRATYLCIGPEAHEFSLDDVGDFIADKQERKPGLITRIKQFFA